MLPNDGSLEAQNLEGVLQRFEQAWRSGLPPRIEDFLNDVPTGGPTLLVELVHTDLEYRIKARQSVSVEDYLVRFPQLQGHETLVGELRETADRLRAASNKAPIPSKNAGLAGNTSRASGSGQSNLVQPADLEATAFSQADALPPESVAAQLLAPPTEPGDHGRLGHYRVLREIGHGAMGTVYHAFDTTIERDVAIKVILRDSWSPEAEQRFEREAKAIAKIDHDHVVRIHHFGRIGSVLFLEMPLLRGQTLDKRLSIGQRLPIADAIKIGLQIAEGLSAAHACGLVHRDIKPANVFLSEEGDRWRVRILDLGLARETQAKVQLTTTGFIVGTPSYMSPEQADGKTADARADLFSLGVVLYHMLTGANPFSADSLSATIFKIIRDQPPPVGQAHSDVPAALSKLIEGLMAKDPNQRPASAEAVAEQLRSMRISEQLHDAPAELKARPSMPPSMSPWLRRWTLPLTAATSLGLIFALTYIFWPRQDSIDAGLNPIAKPLKLKLHLFIMKQGNNQRLFDLDEPNVLPLKAGDGMRIEATTARPAFFYVLNLTADGNVYPMYPWRDNDWDKLEEEKGRTTFSIPDPSKPSNEVCTLDPGPSGIEAIVVLARETPLTKTERDRIRDQFLIWPPDQGGFDPLRGAAHIGEDVFRFIDPRDEKDRGPVVRDNIVALKDPVLRLRRLLQTEISDLGVVARGDCYTFKGEVKN